MAMMILQILIMLRVYMAVALEFQNLFPVNYLIELTRTL